MSIPGAVRRYVPIEELDFFRDLERLSDSIWALVYRWEPFLRQTIGQQLVRSLDSIGANLVEGDGRYSDKESLHFFSIAKGSARETRYWLRRLRDREMIPKEVADDYLSQLESIMRRLSALITTRRKATEVREDSALYLIGAEE